MTRRRAAAAVVALCAGVSSCSGVPKHRPPPTAGVRLDPTRTCAVRLAVERPWIDLRPDDGPVTDEVRVWDARDGWPCVSGWYSRDGASDERLLPRRGFAPLAIR